MSQNEVSLYHRQFEVLRKAQGARDFQLVLCVGAWDDMGECLMEILEQAVAEEEEKGTFDNFPQNRL